MDMSKLVVKSDKSVESRPRVLLSTGKVIVHHPFPNGAHEACVLGGGEMTDSEWIEYANVVKLAASSLLSALERAK